MKKNTGMRIVFEHLPLQPTDNHLYATLANRRRIATKKHKHFKAEFNKWARFNKERLEIARKFINDEWRTIKVNIILCLPKSMVLTKDGNIKKFDAQNRQKLLLDCLALHLRMDDKLFSKVSVEKTIVDHEDASVVCVVANHPIVDTEHRLKGLVDGR